MPHRSGRCLNRLVIVVIAAEEGNEARPRILWTERDVAVARKRRLDALAPSGWCDDNALVSAGVKDVPVCWDFGGGDVAVQPRRDAGIDGGTRRAKDGGGLVRAGLRRPSSYDPSGLRFSQPRRA